MIGIFHGEVGLSLLFVWGITFGGLHFAKFDDDKQGIRDGGRAKAADGPEAQVSLNAALIDQLGYHIGHNQRDRHNGQDFGQEPNGFGPLRLWPGRGGVGWTSVWDFYHNLTFRLLVGLSLLFGLVPILFAHGFVLVVNLARGANGQGEHDAHDDAGAQQSLQGVNDSVPVKAHQQRRAQAKQGQ
jgi:hypothetical protein